MLPTLRVRRLVASAALGLGALAVAPPASASPESDAKDLFARGRDLRNANDCGSAAPLFRKAWQIYPQGLGSLRNLAECEEALGHFASSRRAWLDLKRALITAPNDPKYDGWDKDADESAARLKPKVASFIVDVYVKSPEGEALANESTGVEILVNGESVGTALVGTPLERDPGSYRIRAQMTDAQPVEQTVNLAAGDNPHVTIRLTVTPKPKNEAPPTEDHSTRRTVGWIVTGVGAAALVGSGVTFLLRQGALGDLDDRCSTHRNCPEDLRGTVDTGKTMSTLTSVLLPVGVVGVGAGLALVFTSKSSPSSAESGKAAGSVRVSPSLGGLSVSGRF